jgi:hypothetical protein
MAGVALGRLGPALYCLSARRGSAGQPLGTPPTGACGGKRPAAPRLTMLFYLTAVPHRALLPHRCALPCSFAAPLLRRRHHQGAGDVPAGLGHRGGGERRRRRLPACLPVGCCLLAPAGPTCPPPLPPFLLPLPPLLGTASAAATRHAARFFAPCGLLSWHAPGATRPVLPRSYRSC